MLRYKPGLFESNKVYPVALLLPAAAIMLRALYRLDFYAGWETIGAANGLFLLKKYHLFATVKEIFWLSRHFQYWASTSSILFSLFPGLMSSYLPWEFWPQLHVLAVFIFSLWLCGVALQLRKGQWSWLALALASSPALLSFAIVGYPYISGCLPHALALLVIFHPRFRKNRWLVLVLGLLTIEVSWHVYELGKTVFLLFFLASFFLRRTGWKHRVIYFFLGTVSVGLLYFNSSKGTEVVLLLNAISMTTPAALFSQIGKSLQIIFWDPGLDLPVLPVLGLCGLFFLRRDRLFFTGILAAQWILVLLLSFHGLYALQSRRFLLVEFYNIVVLLVVVKQWSEDIDKKSLVRYWFLALFTALACGSAWQFIELGRYTRVSVHQKTHSLPYTYSADFNVQPQYVEAANSLVDMVGQGKKIILIYNYHTYQENNTDPVGLLERLYLKLGHEKFVDTIFIFSDKPERYSSVPIIPLPEVYGTLKDLTIMQYNGSEMNWLDEYYVVSHPVGISRPFIYEAGIIMQALRDNFSLIRLEKKIPPFSVYRILPLQDKIKELSYIGP